MNFKKEIEKLKKEKNAVILAHFYQTPEIQQCADFVGDSLALSQKAASTEADIIVFAGVHFMAETAKILNPNKKVLIPDMDAGCSLADSCPTDKFQSYKAEHPNHTVISYINCTAEIKAETDIICTSSNAKAILDSLPQDEKIIFAPDKNLGAYLNRITGREMLLWDGSCIVHHEFSETEIGKLKIEHPGCKVIAHPECTSYMLAQADFVGSTSALLDFAQNDSADTFIVATETGILYNMKQLAPNKTFIPAPVVSTCTACNECPYMKMNTLEKLYNCMKNETPELLMDESLRKKALSPITRMLDISKKANL